MFKCTMGTIGVTSSVATGTRSGMWIWKAVDTSFMTINMDARFGDVQQCDFYQNVFIYGAAPDQQATSLTISPNEGLHDCWFDRVSHNIKRVDPPGLPSPFYIGA